MTVPRAQPLPYSAELLPGLRVFLTLPRSTTLVHLHVGPMGVLPPCCLCVAPAFILGPSLRRRFPLGCQLPGVTLPGAPLSACIGLHLSLSPSRAAICLYSSFQYISICRIGMASSTEVMGFVMNTQSCAKMSPHHAAASSDCSECSLASAPPSSPLHILLLAALRFHPSHFPSFWGVQKLPAFRRIMPPLRLSPSLSRPVPLHPTLLGPPLNTLPPLPAVLLVACGSL